MLRKPNFTTIFISSIFLFILTFFVSIADGAASLSDARSSAERLIRNVAFYSQQNRGKPGTMPEWTGAKVTESFLVHSYPFMEPKYYVMAVSDTKNKIISVIGVDAETGDWLWYSNVANEQDFFPVKQKHAAEIAEEMLKSPIIKQTEDFIVVSMPDKKLYWYIQSKEGGLLSEIFVDTHDRKRVFTETTKQDAGLMKTDLIHIGLENSDETKKGTVFPTFDYPSSYEISGVPYHVQTNADRCGPAALEMYMDFWGEDIDQVDISNVVNCSSAGSHAYDIRRGAHFSDNSTAILDPNLHGYDERSLGYGAQENQWSNPDESDPDYPDRYNDLKQIISSNYPLILLTWYDSTHAIGHFRVLKGYIDDMSPPTFIVHDPWYSAPYYGPDVSFSQTFLVDNLWTKFYRWGMFCAPFKVTISSPTEVNINEQFTVNVTIQYLGPHPFEGQYSASSRSATLTLPAGFSFPVGETPLKMFFGSSTSGSSWTASWQVVAGNNDAIGDLQVVAKGFISGSSYSYPNYSDYIGGKGSKSIRITTTYYVNQVNGNDLYDGLAPVYDGTHGPKKTIQAGIDVANGFLDHVHVLPATYKGAGNRNLTLNGKVISVEAPYGDVIIDCENSARAFIFTSGETLSSVVDGFIIQNGYSSGYGGGIYISSSSPTIRNCIIENCQADNGAGIYCYSSNSMILNCVIKNNLTMEIGCGGSGIYCRNGIPTIKNSIIAGNRAIGGYGGGVYCYSSGNAVITNCTITLNYAVLGDGIACNNSNPTISNTILWDNGAEIYVMGTSAPYVSYSDIEGGWSGSGSNNIDRNPEMLGDLHITGWSPCIDAGIILLFSPTDDIDGESRPQGVGIDIGADEFLDSDGDGLSDFSEDNTIGTDKNDPDWDDDEMSDGFEVRYNFDPFDPDDAIEDYDGDGRTNKDECYAGTDPTDPLSFFGITNITKSGTPLTTTITWNSVTGKLYAVYYSDEAMSDTMTWTLAEGDIPASGSGENTWTDDGTKTTPSPNDSDRRHYKIGVQ